jgi:hypothetical protein
MNTIDEVIAEIRTELVTATAKFPTWPTDPLHAVGVVGEESGELYKAVLQQVYEPHKNNPDEVRKEALQTAAMAIRFLVSLDRYDWTPGYQHAQDSPIDDSTDGLYYVLHNGSAWFVKDAACFISQGGLSESWGKNWKRVRANSVEHAREVAAAGAL